MSTRFRKARIAIALGLAGSLLGACGGDDAATVPAAPPPPVEKAQFELTLVNATAFQPMSPPVLIAHQDGFQLFSVGQAASVGLERLAEGAETSPLMTEAGADVRVSQALVGTSAPILPGGSAVMTVEVDSSQVAGLRLSLATMLVNTNDAIAGLNGRSLSTMLPGDSVQVGLVSYDTGTEANSETAATMPGPVANGAGYDVARDDLADVVSVHPGAVTADDGLVGSALDSRHRWDHPAALLTIRRLN